MKGEKWEMDKKTLRKQKKTEMNLKNARDLESGR